jgi:hypothetical protein
MLCPECNRSFEGSAGACPRCGGAKGVVKTSTILISSGERQTVYRSVEEVPDSLKRQLIRSTNGLNSATIVIADREGRKEIAKAIRNLPGPAGSASGPAAKRARPSFATAAHIIGLAAVVAAAAIVWFIFR